MTLALLGILSAIVPLIVWLWRRKVEALDDPKTQHETRLQNQDEAIAKGSGGVVDLNRQLSDFDRKLPDAGTSDTPPR